MQVTDPTRSRKKLLPGRVYVLPKKGVWFVVSALNFQEQHPELRGVAVQSPGRTAPAGMFNCESEEAFWSHPTFSHAVDAAVDTVRLALKTEWALATISTLIRQAHPEISAHA